MLTTIMQRTLQSLVLTAAVCVSPAMAQTEGKSASQPSFVEQYIAANRDALERSIEIVRRQSAEDAEVLAGALGLAIVEAVNPTMTYYLCTGSRFRCERLTERDLERACFLSRLDPTADWWDRFPNFGQFIIEITSEESPSEGPILLPFITEGEARSLGEFCREFRATPVFWPEFSPLPADPCDPIREELARLREQCPVELLSTPGGPSTPQCVELLEYMSRPTTAQCLLTQIGSPR